MYGIANKLIGGYCAMLLSFLRREPVLCAAGAAALLSMLAVPPSAAYLGYVDLRVLCLLFCLMAVVAGLQSCQLFSLMAQRLLAGRHNPRFVMTLLVLLPFFTSMLVTNDVSLITFVPFAILVLRIIGRSEYLIPVIVLQTVAANLGSMATPVGNPQNLFLYASYELSAGSFFGVMVPLTLLSLVGLLAACLFFPGGVIRVDFSQPCTITSKKRLGMYLVLFLLCLLTVFRVLPYGALTVLVAVLLLAVDRPILKKVDYCLLLTFVCFFIFAGNIGAIEQVKVFLESLLSRSAVLSSILASQVISNVPAAVLLAGFTDDWRGLLVGTNLGGLGTLIASLASLISFKLYAALPEAKPGRYLAVFTAVNLAGLAILVPLSFLL